MQDPQDAAIETAPEGPVDDAATQQDAEPQIQPPAADEPPAWAREFIQSNRTLQGQVRALESRLAQREAPPQYVPPPPDPLAGFEPASEGERILAAQLLEERRARQATEMQVAQLAREQMTRQQQAQLEKANQELAEIAELAGVDWKEVAVEAAVIVPDQDYGRKVVEIIKAKRSRPATQRQAAIDAARSAGQFGEQRRSGGAGAHYSTAQEVHNAHVNGEFGPPHEQATILKVKEQLKRFGQ